MGGVLTACLLMPPLAHRREDGGQGSTKGLLGRAPYDLLLTDAAIPRTLAAAVKVVKAVNAQKKTMTIDDSK